MSAIHNIFEKLKLMPRAPKNRLRKQNMNLNKFKDACNLNRKRVLILASLNISIDPSSRRITNKERKGMKKNELTTFSD